MHERQELQQVVLDRVRIVLDNDVVKEDLCPLIIEHNWWTKSRKSRIGRDASAHGQWWA
jgi:hypothetical protein